MDLTILSQNFDVKLTSKNIPEASEWALISRLKNFILPASIFTIIILLTGTFGYAQVTRYAIANGQWDQGSTWSYTSGGPTCNCTPDANSEVHIGEAGARTVSYDSDGEAKNLTIYSGGTLNWTSGNDQLDIHNGGTVDVRVGGVIDENGNNNVWIDFIDASNTFLIVNGTMTIDVLRFDGGGTTSISGSGTISLTQDLDINSAATINSSHSNLTITRDILFDANNISFTNTGVINVGRDINFNQDDCSLNNSGTISTVDDLSFNNDRCSVINDGVLSLGDDIVGGNNDDDNTITNNLSGAFYADRIDLNSADDFIVSNYGIFNLTGDIRDAGNPASWYNYAGSTANFSDNNVDNDDELLLYADYSSNTINYNGSQNQDIIIPQDAYWSLTLSGTGIKETQGNLDINGDVTIEGDAALNPDTNNNDLTVGGDWTNKSTNADAFDQGNETVTFDGSTTQTITNASGETFYDLVFNNTNGIIGAGDISVPGSLTLTDGVIDMGVNRLTLGDAPTNEGIFNYTAGAVIGEFERWIANASTSTYDFYVGNSTNTNTVRIDLNSGTIGGSLIVEYIASDPGSAGLPANDGLVPVTNAFTDGYWTITPANGFSVAVFDLTLDGTGMTSNTIDQFTRVLMRPTSGDDWMFEGTHLPGADPIVYRAGLSTLPAEYGLGTTGAPPASVTWYTLGGGGDWTDPTTWTLDGAGLLPDNPGNSIPGILDNVVILSGATVVMNVNDVLVSSLELVGELQVGASSGHDFTIITGNGKMFLNGSGGVDNFPDGVASLFADPVVGGTVEYNGTGLTMDAPREFNHFILNLTNPTDIMVLMNDLVINGDFTLTQGEFQINDNSATNILNLTISGAALVDANASLTVGQGDTRNPFQIGGTLPGTGNYHRIFHQVTFGGDFTNNGTVRFTNQAQPDYDSFTLTGAATAIFTGNQDNTVSLFGTTDFYNLVVNKGIDRTFVLEINSDNTSNFALYGPNNQGSISAAPFTEADREIRKALWIYHGTLKLTDRILIPSLTEGGEDYIIGGKAGLWLNGQNVTVFSTASNASQVPTGAAGINTGSGNQALTIQGLFRIDDGFAGTRNSAGFIFRDISAGEVLVNGGTINVSQFRSSSTGSGQGTMSYIQTGGDVLVRNDISEAGERNQSYALFSMSIPEAVFIMTGGTLTTYGRTTAGTIFINSDPGKYNVTGGDLFVEIRDGDNPVISSKVPFWNVTLDNDGTAGNGSTVSVNLATSGGETILNPDLIVLNNLVIKSGVTLDHNGNDVEIGSDFTIENGADYLYDASKQNTTTINGIDNSFMAFYNRTGGANDEQRFWNLIIDKPSDKTVSLMSGKADLTGNENNLLRIDGDFFKLLSGTLDQGAHSIRMYGDTLVNYQHLTIFNPAITDPSDPNGINDVLKMRDDGGAATIVVTADTSRFGGWKQNSDNEIIVLNTDVKIDYLEFRHGRINIQDNKLTVDYLADQTNQNAVNGTCNNCFSVSDMIMVNGAASDGGLSIYIPSDGNNPDTGTPDFLFPFGIGDAPADATGLLSKYTPVTATLSSVSDDGYITIRPVDKVLATTNPVGDVLSYYWKVDYQGFTPGSEPDIIYQFTYVDADTDGGNEAGYVPGKVLDLNPFTRSSEIAGNINTTSNVITFNGDIGGGEPPFALEFANYTAGEPSRFTGVVEVYYTRRLGDAANMNWRTLANWTLATNSSYGPHDSRQPAATDYPKAGDIAYVGWVPYGDPAYTDGKPHGMEIDQTETFAELRFTQMTDISGNPVARDYAYNFQFRPTVCINPGGFMNTGAVSGEGAFWLRSAGTTPADHVDPDFSLVDLGAFAREDSAYMIYESTSDAFVYDNVPEEVPNLMIAGDGWGGANRNFEISTDVTVKEDFELLGDVNLILSSDASGDFLVEGDLRIFRLNVNGNDSGGNGEIAFPNDASRTIEVLGDLELINQNAIVNIRAANAPVQVSNLIVHGNISQNNVSGGGLQLSAGAGVDYVHLFLKGEGDHEFNQASGADASLYAVTIDKGSGQSNSFSFNGNFSLDGPTSGAGVDKALTIANGLAVINNSSINIDLTTGDDDFNLPASGGLQVTQGQVNVGGDDSGIFLDGSLIIDGGTVNMDDALSNGNNYIEYSASGSALIDISDGSLIVGSQIRGNLVTTTSVLNYTQTGGTVEIGKNAAPEGSRGVLEILNTGSNFTYTGGTLTLVRQNSATPSVAALRILPTFSDISQTIYIGNADTPGGQTSFGINANVPLSGLTITGGPEFPTGIIQVNPLNVTGTLNIAAGAGLDGNGIDLILEGDFVNNGTYTPNANTTVFSSAAMQSISGTGTTAFYDFEKSGTGTLTTDIAFTISNETNILEGTFDDNGNTIDVQGNVTIDATHQSSGGLGDGLRFSGAIQQQLARTGSGTSTIGIMTIANANGVVIPEGNGYNFDIDAGLQMNGGIFNIGSSAVTLGVNADLTTGTSFSISNMVVTNSSFTDNGLGKTFPAGYTGAFLYPVGEVKYTPVTMDFSVAGGTTGTNAGTIYVRPANEYHPTVNDGIQGMPAQADIDNVLQYYWTLRASGLAGFSGNITFQYDQADVSVTESGFSEADYIPARILAFNNPTNLVNKYDATEVDETSNQILFSAANVFTGVDANGISGDYFGGIDEAIPDNVATYTVDVDGGSVAGDSYDIDVPGGGAPSGAVVIIPGGFTLDFDVDNVQLYKTEIQDGGTLEVNDTEFHRLGIVDGTGTLKIVHNTAGNPSLPAGDYGTFFSCAGGGLEYAGTGSYNILGGIPNIRNLTLSGSGDRNFPNINVTVCEDFVLNGSSAQTSSNQRLTINRDFSLLGGEMTLANGSLSRFLVIGEFILNDGIFNGASQGAQGLFGNVIINGGTYNMGSLSHFIIMRRNFELNGGDINSQSVTLSMNSDDVVQRIIGAFTNTNRLYNLVINNRTGSQAFEFDGEVEISNNLQLIDGIINTNNNNLRLGSSATVSPQGGQENSYVNGRVVKTIANAGEDFVFPIGGPTRYRPAYVQDVSTGGLAWEAEYFEAIPTSAPEVSNLTPADPLILTMSTEEYWRITDGNGAPSGESAIVGLSWGDESYVSANAAERQQLRVMVWNEGTTNWDNAGGANYSSGNTQDFGMFNSTGAVSFSEKIFTLGSTDLSNPLPVELVSFTGREQDGQVLLKWETASEQNNDYFLIEHSVDGKTFAAIGEVAGAGTISTTQYYNFAHRNPAYPDNYYRLKQVDFDGAFEYSDVILVRLDSELESEDIDFVMYPNPTSQNSVNVRLRSADYSKPVVIEVVSMSGRLMYLETYDALDFNQDISIDFGPHAASGIYIVKLVQADKAVVKKLILK